MTNFTKIGILATLGTGIAGGSVGLTYALNSERPKTSIRQQIKKIGRNILLNNSAKDNLWTIKLSTYKRDFLQLVRLDSQDITKLKEWFENTLKFDFKSEKDNNYSYAKSLCTVPTNSEKILSENKKLAEDSDWEGITGKYKSNATSDNLISEINKENATKEELSQWCKKALEKEVTDTGNIYVSAKQWCTKEG